MDDLGRGWSSEAFFWLKSPKKKTPRWQSHWGRGEGAGGGGSRRKQEQTGKGGRREDGAGRVRTATHSSKALSPPSRRAARGPHHVWLLVGAAWGECGCSTTLRWVQRGTNSGYSHPCCPRLGSKAVHVPSFPRPCCHHRALTSEA